MFQDTRQELIRSHLPLVEALLGRFSWFPFLEDLRQAGRLGLVKAARSFDPARGTPFAAYAFKYILGEMRRQMARESSGGLSRRLATLRRRLGQERERLLATLGREPTLAELAQALGAEVADCVWALELGTASAASTSVEELASTDGDLGGQVAERVDLAQAMRELTPRQAILLRARFWWGWDQGRVGRLLGISQSQVSRLEAAALARLRRLLEAHDHEPPCA